MSVRFFWSTLILIAVAMGCFAALGLPAGHSTSFNEVWATQYTNAFEWSAPLPRFIPGLWEGLGGYDFFFYAPLPFWFSTAVISPLCAGCAPHTAFVLTAALFWSLSGFTFFLFLRKFFAAPASLIGAAIYMILPYHLLLDWIIRQAAGEFTAYSFVPLIALGMEKLRRLEGQGWILTLGVAGTSLSHLPTALLAGHVFALVSLAFVLLSSERLKLRLRIFFWLALYTLLGLMLSAFYWLPAIALLTQVSPEILFTPYFEAWQWLFSGDGTQPDPGFARLILVCLLASAPFLVGSLFFARGPVLVWILVPTFAVIGLNLSFSEPVWRFWIIQKVQFPWRLLSFVDLASGIAAATLAAQIITARRKLTIKSLLIAVALTSSILPYSLILSAARPHIPDDRRPEPSARWAGALEYLSPETVEVWRQRLGKDTLDHFDRDVLMDEVLRLHAELQTAPTRIEPRHINNRSMTIAPKADQSEVTLPLQYWSLWQARNEAGVLLETRANSQFGTLEILAPPGGFDAHLIWITLPFHWSEKLGALISLLSTILLLASQLRLGRTHQRG